MDCICSRGAFIEDDALIRLNKWILCGVFPAHTKAQLDDYVAKLNKEYGAGKVKVFRNSERLGLIGTRTFGAKMSTGDAIVFLDAHCECNKNWLVPLLARIAYDR